MFKEIVTKAVIGKGKKTFPEPYRSGGKAYLPEQQYFL